MSFQAYLPATKEDSPCISANKEKWGVEESGQEGMGGKTLKNPISSEHEGGTYNGKRIWWKIGRLLWILVGMLDGMDFCGHIKMDNGVGACREGCTVKVKHRWCYKADCPVCFKYGIERKRTTERLIEKLVATAKLYLERGVDLAGINSWIFSPPQAWALARMNTIGGITYMRQVLYEKMKLAGVKGGKAIFHPFRVRHWAKDEFKAAKENGYEYGIWDWLRENALLTTNKGAIYFSPHFHVFGFGYLVPSNVFHQKSGGWVYKKIGSDLKGEDLTRSIGYVLTHRGSVREPVIEGKYIDGTEPKSGHTKPKSMDMITEFGVLKTVSKKEEKQKEIDECETCGEMIEVLDGWHEIKQDDGSYWVGCDFGFDENGDYVPLVEYTDMPYYRWIRMCKYWIRDNPSICVVFSTDETYDKRGDLVYDDGG